MGKIKTVIMGDEKAEELARAKAQAKRDGKKQLKKVEANSKEESSAKEDVAKATEILKMMEAEDASALIAKEKDKKEIVTKPTKSGAKKEVQDEKVEAVEKKSKSKKTGKESIELTKPKHGKKYLEVLAKVEKNKLYPLSSAVTLAKATSFSKFDGSIEAHFNVSEKGLRGTVALPHGTGKQIRVAIATDEILEEVVAGKINFDVLVAHPSMMPKLAKVAKILGPKGLMPNPKTGTIGDKPEEIIKRLSSGQFNWKTEPEFPIVHVILGKVSFDNNKIEENYLVLAKSIGKDKLKSAFLKASMGPSVKVQI